jgi:hypothetical protein
MFPWGFAVLLGSRIMTNRTRSSRGVLCAGLAAVFAAGCGGAASHGVTTEGSVTRASTAPAVTGTAGVGLTRGVVAVVGGHAVTSSLLDGWMREQAGEDFYLSARRTMPAGLVSEPENVPACVAAVRAFAPSSGQGELQLDTRCNALYRGVRREALGYLVSSLWASDFAGAHGLAVSDGAFEREFAHYRVTRYNGEANFMRVLASRTRTLSQERFVLRDDMVSRNLLPKLEAGPASPLAKDAVLDAATATCPAEDLVEHCKGYNPSTPSASGPSVRAVMEEIASSRRGRG